MGWHFHPSANPTRLGAAIPFRGMVSAGPSNFLPKFRESLPLVFRGLGKMFPSQTNRIRLDANVWTHRIPRFFAPLRYQDWHGPDSSEKIREHFPPRYRFCAPAILHWRRPTVPRLACNRVTGTRSRIPSLFARQCRRPSRTFDQRFASGRKQSTLSAAFVFGSAAICGCHEPVQNPFGMVQNGDHRAWVRRLQMQVARGHPGLPKLGSGQRARFGLLRMWLPSKQPYSRLLSRPRY
jgi:hypothetical protein